jgi:hypothetical protein
LEITQDEELGVLVEYQGRKIPFPGLKKLGIY